MTTSVSAYFAIASWNDRIAEIKVREEVAAACRARGWAFVPNRNDHPQIIRICIDDEGYIRSPGDGVNTPHKER